jgi:glycosyltransferase involved in cell wall biosynthesis
MLYPKVSICIPAYQKPKALKRLLQTIQKQTYTHFEVVITDDSNNNAVREVAESFSEHLDIKYYRNPQPLGMAGNWNQCIEKASFNWIKMMHDDDFFVKHHALEIFVNSIANTKYDFVFCAAKKVGESVVEISRLNTKKLEMLGNNIDCLVFQNYIGHPSVTFFKKDAQLKFDQDFKWVIDIDFYIKYLSSKPNWHYIDDVLVGITKDDNQVSAGCFNNPNVEIPEYLLMLHKLNLKQSQYTFFCIWELVRKFKIKESSSFKEYYPQFITNALIDRVVAIQRWIPNLILKQTPINKKLMTFFYHHL